MVGQALSRARMRACALSLIYLRPFGPFSLGDFIKALDVCRYGLHIAIQSDGHTHTSKEKVPMTIDLIRLPLRFYDDHEARDLDTPKAVKRSKSHVWIDATDPAIPELLSDARHYASDQGWDPYTRGICASARATVGALGCIGKETHNA